MTEHTDRDDGLSFTAATIAAEAITCAIKNAESSVKTTGSLAISETQGLANQLYFAALSDRYKTAIEQLNDLRATLQKAAYKARNGGKQ